MTENHINSIILPILKIDSQSSLNFYSDEDYIKLKENICTFLEFSEEYNHNELIKYIEKLLIRKCKLEKKESKFQVPKIFFDYTLSISKIQYKDTHVTEEKITKEISKISKQIKNNSLKFEREIYESIARIIKFSFSQLNKIKNKNQFLKEINLLYPNRYPYTSIYGKNSLNNLKSERNILLNKTVLRKRSRSSSGLNESKCKSTEEAGSECWEKVNEKDICSLPESLKNLLKILNQIENLKFSIKSNKQNLNLEDFILVCINLKWLFQNVVHLSLDYESDLNINLRPKNKIKKNKSKPQYKEYTENKFLIDMILIKTFLISQFLNDNYNVKNLDINIPNNYDLEVKLLSKFEKISLKNFHILDLLNLNKQNLNFLNISCNSIESKTFKRIISLIHASNNLRHLKLSLFPINHDPYFTLTGLVKIFHSAEDLEIDSDSEKINIDHENDLFLVADKNEYFLNLLVHKYATYLEYLIQILKGKLNNLKSLDIQCHLPQMIYINDRYLSTLYKFLMNVLSICDPTLTQSQIKKFELSSNNFPFNCKKFRCLNKFLENFGIDNNKIVKDYKLNLRTEKILKFVNIIPLNVRYLSLGQLDNIAFLNMVNFLEKNRFEFLISLKIYLSDFLFNLKSDSPNEGVGLIQRFFESSKNSNLEYVYFSARFDFPLIIIHNILKIVLFNVQHRNRASSNYCKLSQNIKLLYTLNFNESIKTNLFLKSIVDDRLINLIFALDKKLFKIEKFKIKQEQRIKIYRTVERFLYFDKKLLSNYITID